MSDWLHFVYGVFVVWSLLWCFKRQGLLCLTFGDGSSPFWWRWWEEHEAGPSHCHGSSGRSGPARQEDMQQEKETTLHVVTSRWLEAEWLLILSLTLAQASLNLTPSVPVNSWPFVFFSFSRCGITSVSCHAQYPHRCYILTHMSTNN